MMPKLLFMLKLWLSVIDINDARHTKRDEQRINDCSIAFSKMMGLVYARRWNKRNRTDFDGWGVK